MLFLLALLQLPDLAVDPAAFSQFLLNAIMSKQWGLFAAVLVTGLVAATRLWGPRLPLVGSALGKFLATSWGPLVLAVGGSVAGALGTALLSGSPVTVGLVLQALLIGLGGTGVFEAQKQARQAAAAATGKLQSAEDVDAFLKK